MFKNGIGDLASVYGLSPSDAVLHLVTNELAKTDKGKALAQSLYGCDTPSCQNAYCALFEELAALISPSTQDAKRLVKHFFRHSLDFGISINTEDIEQYISAINGILFAQFSKRQAKRAKSKTYLQRKMREVSLWSK